MRHRFLAKNFCRRFARDERGAMAIMGAIMLAFVAGALAIGVDSASLFVEKRRAQGAVDLAAIAAARDVAHGYAAAQATISDNGIPAVDKIVLTTGNYIPDPALAPAARFRPNMAPVNAARVELRNRAPVYFARAFLSSDTVEIASQATAVASAAAAFSVGSRLLSLDGGILNSVLGRLLGGNVSLSVMDYEALAAFNVDLFRFSDALSSKVDGKIGTYEELAAADTSVGEVIDALIEVARDSGSGTALLALQELGNSSNTGTLGLSAGRLVDFGQQGGSAIGEGGAAFALRASALTVLTTAAQIANGSRQVEVVTGLAIPGLASLTVGILIGERPRSSPWIAIGERDVRVYTAQTRVRLIAEAGGSGLLAAARIRLPVFVDIASAEARLAEVSCGADPSQDAHVTLAVRPSLVDAWIGEPVSGWADFTAKPVMNAAQFVNVAGLVTANGSAHVTVSNVREEQVTFDWDDISALRAKTVRTSDFTSSLVGSLADHLNLNVKAGGLALLSTPALTKLVLAPLLPAAKIVDNVLNGLLDVLGIGLGEADTWVHGVRCDGAVLVN